MKYEIKTKKEMLDGTVREIYDYIEIENEEIKHGKYKYYDYNGNLKAEFFYEMGIKNGSAKEYSNGELQAEGNYKDGKKIGEWKIRNYRGEIEKITFIEGVEDEVYFKNKAMDKYKSVGILFSLAMISITIACIFQINNLLKEDSSLREKENKEINFQKQYEEKEIEEIIEFPKEYKPITEN